MSKCPFGQLDHVFGICPSGTAVSWCTIIPNILRNRQRDFQSGVTGLHALPPSTKNVSHPCQIVLSLELFILSTFDGYKMECQSCFDLHFSDD